MYHMSSGKKTIHVPVPQAPPNSLKPLSSMRWSLLRGFCALVTPFALTELPFSCFVETPAFPFTRRSAIFPMSSVELSMLVAWTVSCWVESLSEVARNRGCSIPAKSAVLEEMSAFLGTRKVPVSIRRRSVRLIRQLSQNIFWGGEVEFK